MKKRANKLTPAVVRKAVEEAVKKAVEARDMAWMRAIENHRRAWEKELAELMTKFDGGLHKVPFTPPSQDFTVEVRFGKGFGAHESKEARRSK